MDLYRLFALISEHPQACEGRRRLHIAGLLNRAYPPLPLDPPDLGKYAEREPKMFFSRARLNEYFKPLVNELLGCICNDCRDARNKGNDKLSLSERKMRVQSHPWILGLMIYLGKLHYIYYWIKWDFFNSKGELKSGILDERRVEKYLIECPFDRSIFHQAYLRAVSIFSPMTFEIEENGTCPNPDLEESKRFPYLDEEPISTNGFYGVMTKVHIRDEHLNKKMIELVTKRYPTSGTNAGSNRKLLFALKSVTPNRDSQLESMERNALDMVSRIEGAASENMITLLFAYTWKERTYFLFPFIELNLEDVLRKGARPRDLSSKLGQGQQLPEHWLWREMEGVCCALSVFHRKMENPFPDDKGVVIALHFDLKPANILVTAEPKLKITDFGQSIIQICQKGEDESVFHNPGDLRYAAPESRPTLNYKKDNQQDIAVLLNYDVWSLGCIMVEVLIHMLDQQSLAAFDEQLAEEGNAGFFTGTALKKCVNLSLEGFQELFSDKEKRQYTVKVSELLREMLRHDVKDRPYSWQVFKRLEEAKETLMKSSSPLNKISQVVTNYQPRDWSGFRQLGWENGGSTVPFVDMAGITLEVVHQKSGHRDGAKDCRIQLFRKSSKEGPVEIGLVWGVLEKGGIVELDQRKFDVQKAYFSPTYLFENEVNGNGRFGCELYPMVDPPGQRKTYDLAFVFEFASLQDVLTFQGTLMQRKISSPIRATVEEMTPKKSSILSKEHEAPVFNKDTSHIQLWAGCDKPVGSSANDTNSIAPSISGSSALVGPSKNEQCSTMVVFFESLSPLVIPLNDGRKWFKNVGKSQGKRYVKIVYRKDHRSFTVRQLPSQPAWQGQNPKEPAHTPPSVLLEAKYENVPQDHINEPFKMESMKIILENSADRDRLRGGTSKEWRID